jgi:hypothetical protein
MMIVDRTDQDALAIRDVVLPAASAHSLCACTGVSSGTLQRLRRDELLGKVWKLDGRESLSRWLRLGQLRVACVRSRLIAREIQKDMNLFGVRLVPMVFA